MTNVGGWDMGRMRFEKAIGAGFALSGLARALVWWIDRDMARRAVPERVQQFHRGARWPLT